MNAEVTGKFEFTVSNRLFLSDRKMELSSGKLARFADGSAVVQVKKKVKICATSKFLDLNSHC